MDTSRSRGFVPFRRRFAGIVTAAAVAIVVVAHVSPASADPPSSQDLTYGTAGQMFPDNTRESSIRPLKIQLDSSGRSVTFATVNSVLGKPKARIFRATTSGVADTTFGSSGWTSGVDAESTLGGTLQSDGKILLLSMPDTSEDSFTVVVRRYLSTGEIDSGFGTNGAVTVEASNGRHWYNLSNEIYQNPFGTLVRNSTNVRAFIGVQSAGRIVVVGTSTPNYSWESLGDLRVESFALTSAGAVDTSYGSGGHDNFVPAVGSLPIVNDVALDASGRPVIVATDIAGGSYSEWVMRRNANGGADVTFDGDSGIANGYFQIRVGVSRLGGAVAFGTSGTIYIAGWSNGAGDIFVVKTGTTGVTDSSFGTAGVASRTIGQNDSSGPTSLTVQPDGKIIVTYVSSREVFVDRYTTTGGHDGTFGTGGVARATNEQGSISGSVVQSDGKIVVATTWTAMDEPAFAEYLGVVRLTAGGAFDNTFGYNHQVVASVQELTGLTEDTYLLNGPAGSMYAVSEWRPEYRSMDEDALLVRKYLSTGQLDTSWGGQGSVGVYLGRVDLRLYGAAVDSQGGIAALGSMWTQELGDYALVIRLNPDGSRNGDFTGPDGNGNGTATLTSDGALVYVNSLALDSQDRVLIVGRRVERTDPNDVASPTVEYPYLMRLDAYGAYDSAFAGGIVALANPGSSMVPTWVGVDQTDQVLTVVTDWTSSWVRRYLVNGALDTSYGSSGSVFVDTASRAPGFTDEWLRTGRVDSSGRLVVAGYYNTSSGRIGSVFARILSTGQLDANFDGDSGTANGIITRLFDAGVPYYPISVVDDGSSTVIAAMTDPAVHVDVLTPTGAHASSIPGGVFTSNLGGWVRGVAHLSTGTWMLALQKDLGNDTNTDFLVRLLTPVVATTTTLSPGVGSTTLLPSQTVPQGAQSNTTVVAAPLTSVAAPAAAAPVVAPPVAKSQPVLSRRKAASLRSVAVYVGMSVPAGAKLTATIASVSKRVCFVSGVSTKSLKVIRAGKCRVTVTVSTVRAGRTTTSRKTVSLVAQS